MEKHKRETKSKKHNDHYGLSLTIDNSHAANDFRRGGKAIDKQNESDYTRRV